MNPENAVVLAPGQRKLVKKKAAPTKPQPRWEEHKSDYALDPWGVALRVLKEQGVSDAV